MDVEDIMQRQFIRINDELKHKKIIKNDTELAEKLEVSPQSIYRLKGGQMRVTLNIIIGLHKHFNINPSFFFAESTPMFMGEMKHYDADGGEVLILQEERQKGYEKKLNDLEEQLKENRLIVSLLKEKMNLKDE